jgi:hypothetical protein
LDCPHICFARSCSASPLAWSRPRSLGAEIALYAGHYADSERTLIAHERDGQLYFDLPPMIANAQLRPLSANRFRVAGLPAGSTMTFDQPGAGQAASGMVVRLPTGREFRLGRER